MVVFGVRRIGPRKFDRSTISPMTMQVGWFLQIQHLAADQRRGLGESVSASARRMESGSIRMSSSMNRICSQSVFFSAHYMTRL